MNVKLDESKNYGGFVCPRMLEIYFNSKTVLVILIATLFVIKTPIKLALLVE